MMKIGGGVAAGIGIAACLYLGHVPAAHAQYYYNYPNPYRSHAAPAYHYGTHDPAFGYEPRGDGSPHPYGPEPGGGFYHEGQYGIGHTD